MKRVNNVNGDLNLKATATIAYNNLVTSCSVFSAKFISDCGGYFVVVGRLSGCYALGVQVYNIYKDEVIFSATYNEEMDCSSFSNLKGFKGFHHLYNEFDKEALVKPSRLTIPFAKFILLSAIGLTDKNAVDLLKSRKALKTTPEERQFLHRGFEMFNKSERKWLATNLFPHLM